MPWEMVAYAIYADKLGWTPQQVDQLTIEQDEWLMPILGAIQSQRDYNETKAIESAQRKTNAQQGRGYP